MNGFPVELAAPDLNRLLSGPNPPVLVDVRLDEDRLSQSLPGAIGNCVYEVAFEGRMPTVAQDKNRPVCVYGAASDSMESRLAAEKLCRMGYSTVYDLRCGIEGWRTAGFLGASPAPVLPVSQMADGDHTIDLAESHIRWIGRNLLNKHEGEIALKAGWLRFLDGELVSGGFVIDMKKINSTDLAGDSLHDVLVNHLLSHDFFDSDKFPEATFAITAAAPVPAASPGSPNLQITGDLALKGKALPLSFAACSGITPEGKAAAQATLAFDRTLWNVLYGSGKWFRNPGGHLVNDLIELQLRIVTS